MKTLITAVLFALSVGFLGGAETIRDDKPAAPFQREQTKGLVRVVLLSVNRTTTFTSDGFKNEKNKDIHAVPGCEIVFVMEALGSEPVTNKISGETSVFVGKKDYTAIVAENISAGGSGGISSFQGHAWGEFGKKPEVSNPKRAVVYNDWHRGVRIPNGNVDLHITVGFNNHSEEFVFQNVPLE
jgi:hypothetical protein